MTNKRVQKIIEETNDKLPLSGNLYKKNRRRISLSKTFKMIFLSAVSVFVFIIVVFGFINNSRSKAESVTQENVIEQLSKQLVLPDDLPKDFLRVSNAKTLASQDDFYKNVKNGDYIIVYDTMALVYDFAGNKIENVKTIK